MLEYPALKVNWEPSPRPRGLHALDGGGVQAPLGFLPVFARSNVHSVVLREVRLEAATLHVAVESFPMVNTTSTSTSIPIFCCNQFGEFPRLLGRYCC